MLSLFTLDSDLTHFPVSLGLENEGYQDDLFRAWLVHASLCSDVAMVFFISIPPYHDHNHLTAMSLSLIWVKLEG